MRPLNEQLAADILKESCKQFIEKGYSAVTVRSIASAIGVTTGSIYKYYKDKEALFEALVFEPAQYLLDYYRDAQKMFAKQDFDLQMEMLQSDTSKSGNNDMLEYMYDHFDAFKLIACNAKGTRYEDYIDQVAEIEDDSSVAFIEMIKKHNHEVRDIDRGMMHILSTALVSGMFETIRHDMPRDKALEYIKTLQDFYTAGWFEILGIGKS
ncbi:MAG: helix-turn-helix domain-containing protein [Eubacteriales bacterium]|nr:helix-turn-helix domain-containing protein [Eubacteriales bacterium]